MRRGARFLQVYEPKRKIEGVHIGTSDSIAKNAVKTSVLKGKLLRNGIMVHPVVERVRSLTETGKESDNSPDPVTEQFGCEETPGGTLVGLTKGGVGQDHPRNRANLQFLLDRQAPYLDQFPRVRS
jgi:hypothetical protein